MNGQLHYGVADKEARSSNSAMSGVASIANCATRLRTTLDLFVEDYDLAQRWDT